MFISKLLFRALFRRMSDAEYDALDLFPDFEKEDMDAE